MRSSLVRFNALILSIAAMGACGPQEAFVAGEEEPGASEGKIVGGSDANIAALPYQVALMDTSYFQFCGGTIVAPSWVVTANHCVAGMTASGLRVGAGSSRLSTIRTSGQIRSVSQILRYPGYSSPEHGKDVALLQLSQPLDLSGPSAKAIGLVSAADATAGATGAGVASVVSGWGSLSSSGSSFPDTLQSVTVNLVSQTALQQEYGSTITADQLGAAAAGKDSCQGDSGGPLVVTVGSERKLAGVVSWGYGCADARYAGVYSRVSPFESWIAQNIGAVTPTPTPTPTPVGALLEQSTLAGARATWTRFSVSVPAGAQSFTVVTQGGTGDADLYVRFGTAPTTTSFNCRPYTDGNNEICTFASPPAGTWHIGVRAYVAFSGLSVRATLP